MSPPMNFAVGITPEVEFERNYKSKSQKNKLTA